MGRNVIIQAMCSPYPEEVRAGGEIWGVNRTYHIEPRCDRIYFFDPHIHFHGDLLADLAALNIPVFTRQVRPEIPQSREFPLKAITEFFGGLEYFTCTLAYMVAHAIFEHEHGRTIEKLTLNGMFHPRDSMEYLWSKPCVEFWVGVAMGKGMNVELYGYNALCKPLPWESGLYGYQRNKNAGLCIETLSAAYKACYEYPRSFLTADDELLELSDVDGLMSTRAILNERLSTVNEALEGMGVDLTPAPAVGEPVGVA